MLIHCIYTRGRVLRFLAILIYTPQLIKAGADWRRALSGHKKGAPGSALEFAMQKGGHDGALAEPEPEPPAKPEPKAESEFNPGSDSYPTLTPTSTYPHQHSLPLSRRALHRAPAASPAVGAGLPEPL